MAYRTKTYIAADWDHDKDAIDKLYQWKNSEFFSLDFVDAHEYTQARDTSLYCSIKRSLKERLDRSKTFVLIVGEYTNKVRAGSCQYCSFDNIYGNYCKKGYYLSYKSYIEYECEEAVKANMNIVVLYNSSWVNKNLCPEILRDKGYHLPMIKNFMWDYQSVKNVLNCY